MELVINRILIMGAMDVETDLLVKHLKNPQHTDIGGYSFYEGEYEGKTLIVGFTHVGAENAAAATALGISRFNPDIVISQGTSGGHNPTLHRNDIVIGSSLINPSAILSQRKKSGEGTHAEEWELMDWDVFDTGKKSEEKIPAIHSDSKLVEKALKVPYNTGRIFSGTISSSNNWNRELDRINLFNKKYNSMCEEMEGYAITLISGRFGKPSVAIRIISNTEWYEEETYDRNTGIICQQFVLDFVRSL